MTTEHIIHRNYLLLLTLGILSIAIIILPYLVRIQDYKIVESSPSLISKAYSENYAKTNNIEDVPNHDQDSKTVSTSFSSTKKSNRMEFVSPITLDSPPRSIAVNPKMNKIYVANYDTNTISVIDGNTNKVADNIKLDGFPSAIAVNTKTNKVYMVSTSGFIKDDINFSAVPLYDNVYIINGSTNKILENVVIVHKSITSVKSTHNIISDISDAIISINEVTNKIYVANYDTNTISVIDGNKDQVISKILIDGHPSDIAVNTKTNLIYIIKKYDHKISDIEGVEEEYKDQISIINGNTDKLLREDLVVGKSPVDIDVNSKTNKIYVALNHANRVSVIDGNTNNINIAILSGNYSYNTPSIAVNQNLNMIYTIVQSDILGEEKLTYISVLNGSINKLVYNFPFQIDNDPIEPVNIAVNPSTNKIYIWNPYSKIIFGINLIADTKDLRFANIRSVQYEDIPGITVGFLPSSIAVNPFTNKIYVASYESNTISVIDGLKDKVISHITLGSSSNVIVVNQDTNKIYVASYESNKTYVIDGNTNKLINQIPVGGHPLDIAIAPDPYTGHDKLYVVLEAPIDTNLTLSNRASIIDAETNKIVHNISLNSKLTGELDSIVFDEGLNIIYLGSPFSFDKVIYEIDAATNEITGNTTIIQDAGISSSAIYPMTNSVPLGMDVDSNTNMIYAIDAYSDMVDVMDPYIDRHLDRIPVGDNPVAVNINEVTNKIYVANYGSDTISVIDVKTHKIIDNITVGQAPNAIAINEDTNKVYVTTDLSDAIYTIDGSTDKVTAGVRFNVNPPDSGHIKCGGNEFSTNEYHRIEYGVACIAEANSGFRFSSWSQNFGMNSSKIISSSTISDSPFHSLLTALGFKQNDNLAIFNITQYGNFIANFRELPPPIPSEYWIPLYGIIVSSVVGWSIPSIVGWAKSKKENRRLNWYHKKINSLYDNGKLDQNDIEALDRLKTDISDIYAKGKISDQHYQNLKNELSLLYEEIHRKRIDSLNGIADRDNDRLLYKIKNDIEDAYAKGKLSDQHYNLLNKKIESFNTMVDYKTNGNNISSSNQTQVSKRSPI